MNFLAGFVVLVYGLEKEAEAFQAFAGSLAHICPDYFARNLIGSMADQVVLVELMKLTLTLTLTLIGPGRLGGADEGAGRDQRQDHARIGGGARVVGGDRHVRCSGH